MKVVAFTGAGGNEVVEVQDRPEPRPGPHEVLVDVSVAALNPADLHQREGNYPAPAGVVADVAGLDVAGRVVARGDSSHRWTTGDRVFGLAAGGGLAERVAIDERCLAAVPASLDDEAAAAVPEATITAHDALVTQGVFQAGESVLVQGASGAVGSAAVQIAVALGGRVFAVTRSDGAAAAVRAFGAVTLDEGSFQAEARALTDGAGVDVVLELVGASHLAGDLAAIAMRGRIVILSIATGWRAELDLGRLMRRRATIRGTVLRARSIDDKAEAVAAFERDVVPMLADGRVRPAIDEVFPVEEIHRAFDRLGQPGKGGKVLVRFG